MKPISVILIGILLSFSYVCLANTESSDHQHNSHAVGSFVSEHLDMSEDLSVALLSILSLALAAGLVLFAPILRLNPVEGTSYNLYPEQPPPNKLLSWLSYTYHGPPHLA